MSKGKICLIFSALIYGVAPVLAKISYMGGVNGITLTFLRAAVSIPLLFALIIARGQTFRLSVKELRQIAILGVVGGAFPIISIYAAYEHISTGLATTLHFVYPLIIVVVSSLIYKEKITKAKLAAVMLVTVGIFFFVDLTHTADKIGLILALLSGVFYSFYVIYIDYSGLDDMDYVKLTFYLMIIMSAATYIFGAAAGTISFGEINWLGWIASGIISIFVTLGAIPLFQAGVRYEGASTAGIVSALEPITTIIIGVTVLGEKMVMAQFFGGAMILLGVVLAEK